MGGHGDNGGRCDIVFHTTTWSWVNLARGVVKQYGRFAMWFHPFEKNSGSPCWLLSARVCHESVRVPERARRRLDGSIRLLRSSPVSLVVWKARTLATQCRLAAGNSCSSGRRGELANGRSMTANFSGRNRFRAESSNRAMGTACNSCPAATGAMGEWRIGSR